MEYNDLEGTIAAAHGVLDRIEAGLRGSWASRIFWHSVRIKWYTPPVTFSRTIELDHPYRRSHSAIFRYWPTRALVLGFWGRKQYDEDSNLLDATILGRTRTDGERRAWDDGSYQDGEFEGSSVPLLERRPGLRVRATVDAGVDVSGSDLRGAE